MPSTIYFIDYSEDFSESESEFKKGVELQKIIDNDPKLEIRKRLDQKSVYYSFGDRWKKFFDLEEDGDIYLNLKVVESFPELYYKLVEIADALDLCLETEGILAFVPGYGMIYDPEDASKSLPFDLYGYVLREKLAQKPDLNIRDAIGEIVVDFHKKQDQLKKSDGIKRKIQEQQRRSIIRNRIVFVAILILIGLYFILK